jgi:hypothetical protein
VLGIAVLSSALIGTYRHDIRPALAGLSTQVADAAVQGAGSTLAAAGHLGPGSAALVDAARHSFTSGLGTALWVGAAVLATASAICAALAPRGGGSATAALDDAGHMAGPADLAAAREG